MARTRRFYVGSLYRHPVRQLSPDAQRLLRRMLVAVFISAGVVGTIGALYAWG